MLGAHLFPLLFVEHSEVPGEIRGGVLLLVREGLAPEQRELNHSLSSAGPSQVTRSKEEMPSLLLEDSGGEGRGSSSKEN